MSFNANMSGVYKHVANHSFFVTDDVVCVPVPGWELSDSLPQDV